MTYKTGTWGIQAKERNKTRDWESYYLANKEKCIARAKKWQALNPDKRRQYDRNYLLKALGWKKELFQAMGDKCVKCGFSDVHALQVDHVNGNGRNERKRVGYRYWLKVLDSFKKNENQYQLLCANCNVIKQQENNERNQYTVRKGGDN